MKQTNAKERYHNNNYNLFNEIMQNETDKPVIIIIAMKTNSFRKCILETFI